MFVGVIIRSIRRFHRRAAVIAFGHQPGFQQLPAAKLVVAEGGGEVVPAIRRVTNAEIGGDTAIQPPPFQVGDGLFCLRPAQLLLEPAVGFGDNFHQQRGGFFAGFAAGFSRIPARLPRVLDRHLQPGTFRQLFDRLDETQIGVFHQETDGGAVRAATEAMVKLLDLAYRKRRSFFFVERAASLIFRALSGQRHAPVDDLDDIDPHQQLVDKIPGYSARHSGILRQRAAGWVAHTRKNSAGLRRSAILRKTRTTG